MEMTQTLVVQLSPELRQLFDAATEEIRSLREEIKELRLEVRWQEDRITKLHMEGLDNLWQLEKRVDELAEEV